MTKLNFFLLVVVAIMLGVIRHELVSLREAVQNREPLVYQVQTEYVIIKSDEPFDVAETGK